MPAQPSSPADTLGAPTLIVGDRASHPGANPGAPQAPAHNAQPPSPSTAFTGRWIVASGDSNQPANDRIVSAFKQMCNARQYLQQTWDTTPKMFEFANALLRQFPPDMSASYSAQPELQKVDPKELGKKEVPTMVVHPAMLRFNTDASIKAWGHCACQGRMHICIEILEQVLPDGFATANDPMWVTELPDDGANIMVSMDDGHASTRAFRIGYVKGMARTCALLALASMFIQDELSIKEAPPGRRAMGLGGEALPNFFETARTIHAVGILASDRKQLMKLTFKQSVSDHSMQLSFDKLHSDWINRPEQLRRKYGRKEMEDSAEMSCLVEYIYRKTLHTTPLSAADLNGSSCQAYIEGSDRHLSLELSSILVDKPADVAAESVSCIKAMLVKHRGTHQTPQANTLQLMQSLEADNYGILVSSVEHDIKAIQLYKDKTPTWESSVYWEKLEAGQKQWSDLVAGVMLYLKRYAKIVVTDAQVAVCKAFMEYRRNVCSKPRHRVSIENVAVMGRVNWLAPSGVKANQMKCQQSLISSMASDCPQSIILATQPIHSNQQAKLWTCQETCLNSLTNSGLDIDMEFSVLIKDRMDKRDDRPGTMNGRACRALGSPNPSHSGFWKSCKLLDERRTEPTPQIPVSDVVSIDDIDAAPPPTDTGGSSNRGMVRGWCKYEQLGPETCLSILDATFDGLKDASGVGMALFADVHVCTADMLVAWVRKSCQIAIPSYYFGTVYDQAQAEWAYNYVANAIATLTKDGTSSMPGVKAATVGTEQEKQKPMMPQLKCLVWDDTAKVVKVPEGPGGHMHLACEIPLEGPLSSASAPTTSEHNKRSCSSSPCDSESNAKKRRTDAMDEPEIVPTAELKQTVILSVKITNARGACEFRVLLGDMAVITNTGQSELVLRKGMVVAGFGKIGWKRLQPDETVSAKEILVEFSGSSDVVLIGTTLQTLKKAIETRRLQNPGVSVMYRTIEPTTGDPGSFKLVPKDKVVCTLATTATVEEEDGPVEEGQEPGKKLKATQSNAANTLPANIWKANNVATLMWNMRWVQSGLMPQRPQTLRPGGAVPECPGRLALEKTLRGLVPGRLRSPPCACRCRRLPLPLPAAAMRRVRAPRPPGCCARRAPAAPWAAAVPGRCARRAAAAAASAGPRVRVSVVTCGGGELAALDAEASWRLGDVLAALPARGGEPDGRPSGETGGAGTRRWGPVRDNVTVF
ncbi:unnamed protein product [Prorocentrum cordatum]|uniref:Uncharacterized protein n=1 Tax=Prorocentrum cordatum TaxID=2364126 RepID=A0ABN9PFL2_9DINO|nr:unnamed protein product [Polarella glacialis]